MCHFLDSLRDLMDSEDLSEPPFPVLIMALFRGVKKVSIIYSISKV